MATNPTMFPVPLADSGDKNNIFTNTGYGKLTVANGFPTETSLPIASGGVAPARADFNGAFNAIGNHLFYTQKGYIWNYDATQNYVALCMVNDGGTIYICIADMDAGTVAPHSDTSNTYWKTLKSYLGVTTGIAWGQITGTLSNQTDLNNALNGKQATITGGASTITSSNLTASRALVSDSSGKVAVSAVTSTELGYLDGVTSAVQTQLNGKQATITGAATTITGSNLTASRAVISNSDGKVAASSVTSTELGYVSGVTSAIQTQLNNKATKASITAGTAGTSSATSGSSLAVPYVTMNAQGIVTGYGTHTHTVTGFLTGISASSSGTGNAVTAVTASGSSISVTKGSTFLTGISASTSGSGNAVTAISASGSSISVTKGSTFLTSHQSIKTINGNSMVGSGNVTINAGHTWCTTKATTTSSASSTNPAVVVTNYVNGTEWYRVWSD